MTTTVHSSAAKLDLLVIISGPEVVFIIILFPIFILLCVHSPNLLGEVAQHGLLSVLQTSTLPSSVLLYGGDDVEGNSPISSKEKTLLSLG